MLFTSPEALPHQRKDSILTGLQGKLAELEALGTYVNGQHVVFKGLSKLLHNLYLSTGTGLDGTFHCNGSLGGIDAQILQASQWGKDRRIKFQNTHMFW